jgi:hypothetical protein
MALLDYTDAKMWESRLRWLEHVEETHRHPDASYLLSSQGTLLTYDVEKAFCAGAWVSVIVTAHAAIDATIRDTETADYDANSKVTFGDDPNLQWLRMRRNRLVHVTDGAHGIPQEDLADFDVFHDSLEEDARRAVQLLFKTIYANPGT